MKVRSKLCTTEEQDIDEQKAISASLAKQHDGALIDVRSPSESPAKRGRVCGTEDDRAEVDKVLFNIAAQHHGSAISLLPPARKRSTLDDSDAEFQEESPPEEDFPAPSKDNTADAEFKEKPSRQDDSGPDEDATSTPRSGSD